MRPRVIARISPMQPCEPQAVAFEAKESLSGAATILFTAQATFEPHSVRFDAVLGTEKDNVAICDAIGDDIFRLLAKGISCSVFAYGHT